MKIYQRIAVISLITFIGCSIPTKTFAQTAPVPSQPMQVMEGNDFMDLAKSAFSAQDYQNTIFHADKAIDINPDLADAYLLRAQAEEKLGQMSAAMNDLNKAVSLFQEQSNSAGASAARELMREIQ
jgi:Tfp pilus assembly protein PilF